MASSGIFLSYRREDASGHTGRIYDRLSARFGSGQVFMDVVAIDAGTDFVARIEGAVLIPLGELPARQREVVLLRDIEGMSSEEVCMVLALTEGNQRVLLHRGRSRLRQLFEDEFREVR
jgi:hypothetical protein